MGRTIDQIRASKLPSNMMQFAARGALSVPPDENLEILVYLARHNPVFGELARMTLAGWDEKSSLVAAADPQTPREVLDYLVSADNLRPVLLPALLENPSVPESQVAKLAIGASRDSIAAMLNSKRVRSLRSVLANLKSNPFLKKEEAEEIKKLSAPAAVPAPPAAITPKIERPAAPAEVPEFTVTPDATESAADATADDADRKSVV